MIPIRNLRRFLRKAEEQPFYAVKVGIKRIASYLYYDFAGGKAPAPEAVTIFMTHNCNLRCKMCGQWGDKGTERENDNESLTKELDIIQLKKLIDDLSITGTNITLFGGEPFLHKNIIETINYIKLKKLHCLVITNGTMLKSNAENIVKSGLDELNLSLDGNEATHDKIRGINGLFRKISDGIEEINRFKTDYRTSKPFINLQCTINKDNYLNLEEMISVAKHFKANSLTFHQLIFLNDVIYSRQNEHMKKYLPGSSSTGWKGFLFEPNMNIKLLISKIDEIKNIRTDFFVNFYPNFSNSEIEDYYNNPEFLPKSYKPRCISPHIACYIFPDGEVRPCLNLDSSFGNIKKDNFNDIWNSQIAIKFRKTLKQSKIFPACIRCTELFRY